MKTGILAHFGMLEQHNKAMLDGDEKTAMAIRKEANRLPGALLPADWRLLSRRMQLPVSLRVREAG